MAAGLRALGSDAPPPDFPASCCRAAEAVPVGASSGGTVGPAILHHVATKHPVQLLFQVSGARRHQEGRGRGLTRRRRRRRLRGLRFPRQGCGLERGWIRAPARGGVRLVARGKGPQRGTAELGRAGGSRQVAALGRLGGAWGGQKEGEALQGQAGGRPEEGRLAREERG